MQYAVPSTNVLADLKSRGARRAAERAAKQSHSLKHIAASAQSAIRFRESKAASR